MTLVPRALRRALSRCALLLTAAAIAGGCAPAAEALPLSPDPATPSIPPPAMPTATRTPLPPPTLYPSPLPPATPLPTIVIPMLTRMAPATRQPGALTNLWELPERIVPEGFGVEIHFTRASAQELDYIAAGGFRWVRMDMFWHTIERQPGKYDFSEYDVLVSSMAKRGVRIVFILDYGNPIYDNGFPPTSSGGQAAYARFAAVAAHRYSDDGVIWDLWNEPNLDHFWPPEANSAAYSQLALRAVAAIRSVEPTALIVGPALSGFDWPYWHALGAAGLFEQVDAVTFHGYGVLQPEALIGPYLDLRALIDSYSPRYKVPILSGEWGFATTDGGWTEGQQAQYLARQWLFNLSHDINLSIWYDWRDDGTDPVDPEQNFGTVHNDYSAKPSYLAAHTLATTLTGYRFLRRMPLDSPEDYLLLFENEDRVAMAAWTTGDPHTVILPISVYEIEVVDMVGNHETSESEGEGVALPLSQSPRYLLFRPDQYPTYLGGWRPEDTVNALVADASAALPVVFERHLQDTLTGELQVWIGGELRGAQQVAIGPLGHQQVSVPVDLEGFEGEVRAEIRLVLDNSAMAPLQAAMVWLHVTQPEP